MHLLAAKPGVIADGSEAIDLGQTPGDIVILSAADTELACLAAAQAQLSEGSPSLRLASLLQLSHNLSIDTYVEDVVAAAQLVIIRVIGGVRYWSYGVEQVVAVCRQRGIKLAFLPGDDQPDMELSEQSTVPAEVVHRFWQYLVQGGVENARQLLAYGASLLGHPAEWREPRPLLRAGVYWPGREMLRLDDLRSVWQPDRPVATIVFYRALLQAGNLAAIDALVAALVDRGLNPLPIFATSLKEQVAADLLDGFYRSTHPVVTLNCTGFALSQPGSKTAKTPFDSADAPVLQVVLSSDRLEDWRDGKRGLSPRDLAMQVALPEVDGRILSRAISFKTAARYDAATQCNIVIHAPVADRVIAVVDLAAAWARLRETPAADRKIAVVLANYPNRDGRIGNGVGLDTPAGTIAVLQAMQRAGYQTGILPTDGNALMDRLLAGRATARRHDGTADSVQLPALDYQRFFAALPASIRAAVTARWGAPSDDPTFADGAFHLEMFRQGSLLIGLQPARGYHVDPVLSYHDPDLVPPHAYFAFYAYLRQIAQIHAIVHMGKHGNLEWLPGKAIALSEECYPEAIFGQVPHLYPFIVNDPGEGTQAKRRTSAVIIDHMTPPLTRAESYGPLRDLELLVDEYYEAVQLDPRRCLSLREQILDLARGTGLAVDCGIAATDDTDTALGKLDNHLCELKELQIRDGLHIFGRAPAGQQLIDLLVALTRIPRGRGEGRDQSLIRALSLDLDLGDEFDPLSTVLGETWSGPKPKRLQEMNVDGWRTAGDTVERLELLAQALVGGSTALDPGWQRTALVLEYIADDLRAMVEGCGTGELSALLKGLDGRFIAPGPSGAPTRGRLDVLPTGRNFYSVDTRAVPTPTAWALGWKSAGVVLARHRQEHGAWPQSFVLSAWGTANMRTGGDDLAQALALIGVRPVWDTGVSGRVSGFEILPLSLLDRPRVDVTLRVSGFFRDAFPAQIDLFDSAVRAVAKLDEPESLNPIAARFRRECRQMIEQGVPADEAERRAGYRIFGAKPGSYGAGLQTMIDERGWSETGDLARAYLAWGSYAYGAGSEGQAEGNLFESRLRQVDAVLHNQDNREHDLLDSDNYYQFEGGLAATIQHLTGRKAVVWHNDHSRPESPRARSLDEEIARVVRARVVNPKWISGVMRHGYKGAFEMAATVDYLFAFAATADCVADHHFDAVFAAYLADDTVRDFLTANNPAALKEIAAKLLEAQERGLWKSRSNVAFDHLSHWAGRSLAS
jgi:cobaltochelatase CobN